MRKKNEPKGVEGNLGFPPKPLPLAVVRRIMKGLAIKTPANRLTRQSFMPGLPKLVVLNRREGLGEPALFFAGAAGVPMHSVAVFSVVVLFSTIFTLAAFAAKWIKSGNIAPGHFAYLQPLKAIIKPITKRTDRDTWTGRKPTAWRYSNLFSCLRILLVPEFLWLYVGASGRPRWPCLCSRGYRIFWTAGRPAGSGW